jgi:hypothetical protein
MDCSFNGFGVIDRNCDYKYFVDCDMKHGFIPTSDVDKTRFRVARVKGPYHAFCLWFCRAYNSSLPVLDTDDKFETVLELIKKTNEKLTVKEKYHIGLVQGKLKSGMIM